MSESSCVESNSGAGEQRSLVLKFIKTGKETKNVKENNETNEVSEAFTKSETTCDHEQCSAGDSMYYTANLKISPEITENGVVSEEGCCVVEMIGKAGEENDKIGLNAQCSIQQGSNHIVDDVDLTCTEQFSCGDIVSEYSSSQETEIADQCSDIFPVSSEIEFSDYFTDSGSQFSEGSVSGTVSPTFSLFIQYNNEFSKIGRAHV